MASAKKTTAEKTTTQKAVAKKTAEVKAVAKKTVAKKSTTKKATCKVAAVKRAAVKILTQQGGVSIRLAAPQPLLVRRTGVSAAIDAHKETKKQSARLTGKDAWPFPISSKP